VLYLLVDSEGVICDVQRLLIVKRKIVNEKRQ